MANTPSLSYGVGALAVRDPVQCNGGDGPWRPTIGAVARSARFFGEVQKRLASNDLIQSRYSYRERSTEVRLNPFGAMGTGPEMVYEVYPHPE